MAEFYHIYINPKKGISYEQLKKKMDLAVDWFSCMRNLWIVYTTSDEDKWASRLKPLVDPDGSLFICRLDISRKQGWMTHEFWDWIEKNSK